ncbi:MAG TPA: DUF3105 domain-containing protein [Gaiellaceae bacterium]|jgi:hypothetical protein
MARKDRVPNPPKRSQGPQRRTSQSDPAASEQRRRLILLIAAGAAAVAVAVLAIVLLTGGGEDEKQALADAGCTLQSFPALPNAPDHSDVPTLQTKPKWNSSPPTSGPHWGAPAVWDFYTEPVLLVQTVHNLEHGGVVIHYGSQVPQDEVDKIRSFYNEDPLGLVVAPLPSNKDKITLSAWTVPDSEVGTADRGRGWLARCTKFDKTAFSAFVDTHRFKGPERLPPESLAPGS